MIKRAATELFSGLCFGAGVMAIVFTTITMYPEIMLTTMKVRTYFGF